MDKNKNIDYTILFRYFEGNATPEEIQLVRQWQQDPHKTADIQEANEMWTNHHQDSLILKEDELEALFNKNTKKYKSHLLRKSFVYYVVLTLCLVSTLFIFNHYQRHNTDLYIVKTMSNKLGNTEVWLSDNTHIVLSKGSTLKLWDIHNNQYYRAVQLRGKAFFDVAHNPQKPLLIETGSEMLVKVLGTSFVLNTDSANFDLGLISGKVELVETAKLNDKNVASVATIRPGQHIHSISTKKENILNIDSLNYKTAIQWTKPILDFQAMPLGRVLDNLSEYYNMPIECSEALRSQYHCTLQIGEESLSEATHILETILPLKIMINDGKINVIKK